MERQKQTTTTFLVDFSLWFWRVELERLEAPASQSKIRFQNLGKENNLGACITSLGKTKQFKGRQKKTKDHIQNLPRRLLSVALEGRARKTRSASLTPDLIFGQDFRQNTFDLKRKALHNDLLPILSSTVSCSSLDLASRLMPLLLD